MPTADPAPDAGRVESVTDINLTCRACGWTWFGRIPTPDGKRTTTWGHECIGPVPREPAGAAGGEGRK
jgi:hypothetical protein